MFHIKCFHVILIFRTKFGSIAGVLTLNKGKQHFKVTIIKHPKCRYGCWSKETSPRVSFDNKNVTCSKSQTLFMMVSFSFFRLTKVICSEESQLNLTQTETESCSKQCSENLKVFSLSSLFKLPFLIKFLVTGFFTINFVFHFKEDDHFI